MKTFQEYILEAEYQGKKVELNNPFRTPKGPKKFSVYVKNEKGNVVKVNFGDPKMEIKRDDPARRKSFRARHNCDNPGPKWKARYWSCYQWRAGAKVDEEKGPCWDGYKQVGMKKKGGKMVPNCVPVDEEMDPRDHVKKKDDQYVIVAPSGKIVKTFDDKKDAEDWVIKNHDAVMKEVRQG